MKALAIVFKGIEEAAKKEIENIISKKAEIRPACLLFEASEEEIVRLCYKSQTLQRVISLFKSFKITDDFEKDIKDNISNCDFSLLADKTFKVECKRIGKHAFSSQDIEAYTGEVILDNVSTKVVMDNPEREIFVYIFDNDCYIGLDFCGFDLSKREYKVFTHASDFNGAVASSFLYFLGYSGKEKLLDPFCMTGTLLVEAALFSTGKSAHFFQKEKFLFNKFLEIDLTKFDEDKEAGNIFGFDSLMHNISSAKKNSKIAGISQKINFSRIDVDWLDTKFGENEIDIILTKPKEPSKVVSEKDATRLLKELFHQASFVLKKDGKMGLILEKPDFAKPLAENFKLEKEIEIMQGKKKFYFLIFCKTLVD